MFRDGASQAVISSQVGESISQWANVPVYAMSDSIVGTGAVGGAVASIEAFSKRAGELVSLVLKGSDIKSLPFEIRTETVPMFDWRALQRWGIPETRLPPGSVVRYKPISLWVVYRWYIIGALAIFALQAATITGLVLQGRRRRRAENELSESRQFMELAAEAGGIGLWVRDLVQGDLWANPRMRSLLGFEPGDAIEVDKVLARINPDDRAKMMSIIERAQEKGEPFDVEFRTAIPGMPERWIAARGQFVRGPHGQVMRRMGTMIDITERKQTEDRLRQSEENFRRLVETTVAVIWQADMESWKFTYVTPQAVKLLGYPLEQWYEKDFWISHIHPDDRERAIDTCIRMSKCAEEFDFEYRMIRLSGEVVWVHDFVNCQHQAGERPQLRGLLLDVTERKRSEQAIRESEERFRTVANAAPVMIWMSGTDKLCTFCNKGWLDFTGRTLEQELGNGWSEGVHRDDFERCLEIYTHSFGARQEFSMEYRLRRYDGEYRWVMDQGVPRFESDGTFLGYIGTATDITELKRGEEKFRLVVEASANAIVMVNDRGQIVLVNQQTENLFGYSRDELIGQTVEILVPERFRGDHCGHRAAFTAAPQARSMGARQDLYARRKDGSEVRVEIGLNPIRTQEGLLVLTSIVDISARKQAEEALEKERAFLRQVIDIDPNFIFAKDREGRFTLANRAVAEAYGTTVENLIGKTDAEFNPHAEQVEHFHRMDVEVIDRLQERFIPEEQITDATARFAGCKR
jgi:PAS domain S-box-containing protein